MLHQFDQYRLLQRLFRNVRLNRAADRGDSFELVRENLDKARQQIVPIVQNPLGATAAREFQMPLDQSPENLQVARFNHRFEVNRGQIGAFFCEIESFVEYICNSAAHARCKIAAALSQDKHQSVGHVFTAMVSDAFNNRRCAGIAHREAFSGDATEKRFAAGCAIQRNVADEHAFLRGKPGSSRWIYDNSPTGESLTDVVVGVAFERKRDSFTKECRKTLSRGTGEASLDGSIRQPPRTIAARNLPA